MDTELNTKEQFEKRILKLNRLNRLKEQLLGNEDLPTKLKFITDQVVEIFHADFARIWITREGDLCQFDCTHSMVNDGPPMCRFRSKCLHLIASSGRYSHTDGKVHRRIPFGCYKIGQVAAGSKSGFVSNDLQNDPRIHQKEWARSLGLASFAGFKIVSQEGNTIGVLALFSKYPMNPEDSTLLETVSITASQVIRTTTALDELRASEEQFRSFMETASDLMFITDAKKRLTYVNFSMLNTLGYTREEMIGMPTAKILNQKTLDTSYNKKETMRDLIKNGSFRNTPTWVTKDGREVHGEVKIIAIFDEKGQFAGTRGIFRDLTEKKRLEGQLVQSQKLEGLGQLAGGIAHDFNNILTVINGFSEMAMLNMGEDNPAQEDIKQVMRSSEKAEKLVRQLLAFSRKQIIQPKIVNINRTVMDLQKMLLRTIGEDIKIHLDLDKKILPIKADPAQLEQVVINLFVNARDAINQKTDLASAKQITLATSVKELDDQFISSHLGATKGRYLLISITDNGTGMEPMVARKIFEPFFTTKAVGKGTGLGLSTVYGIVKQNKGCIYVDSKPGEGTTFNIYWPVVKMETSPLEINNLNNPETINGGNETVLLVEDDDPLREVSYTALLKLGYDVYVAANGVKAIQILNDKKLDVHLLITDLVMPEMNGKELAAKIIQKFPHIKVLYCSGYSDEQILNHGALEEGINFLAKPYSMKSLAIKLRDILDKKKN